MCFFSPVTFAFQLNKFIDFFFIESLRLFLIFLCVFSAGYLSIKSFFLSLSLPNFCSFLSLFFPQLSSPPSYIAYVSFFSSFLSFFLQLLRRLRSSFHPHPLPLFCCFFIRYAPPLLSASRVTHFLSSTALAYFLQPLLRVPLSFPSLCLLIFCIFSFDF